MTGKASKKGFLNLFGGVLLAISLLLWAACLPPASKSSLGWPGSIQQYRGLALDKPFRICLRSENSLETKYICFNSETSLVEGLVIIWSSQDKGTISPAVLYGRRAVLQKEKIDLISTLKAIYESGKVVLFFDNMPGTGYDPSYPNTLRCLVMQDMPNEDKLPAKMLRYCFFFCNVDLLARDFPSDKIQDWHSASQYYVTCEPQWKALMKLVQIDSDAKPVREANEALQASQFLHQARSTVDWDLRYHFRGARGHDSIGGPFGKICGPALDDLYCDLLCNEQMQAKSMVEEWLANKGSQSVPDAK